MYGLKTYYQDGDNLEHVAKAPNFKEMMSFANELYTEGLLDKEWVVNKKNQWTQKLSAGNVFSTFASYWDTDAANTALASSVGEDAKFYSYKILGNGISADETTYSGRSTLGWDAIAITKNCKNPEAAMKMINYLASEEGQYLLMWGIEGTNWNMEDGKHVPNDDLIEGFQTDFDKTILDTGVRKWTWFVKNGNGTDGTPYDVVRLLRRAGRAGCGAGRAALRRGTVHFRHTRQRRGVLLGLQPAVRILPEPHHQPRRARKRDHRRAASRHFFASAR